MGQASRTDNVSRLSNRHYLKMVTSDPHDKAEARWFSSGKFTCRNSYEQWLQSMLHVHGSLGVKATAKTALPQYGNVEEGRFAALSLDLALPKTPSPIEAPSEISTAWAWGVLYALNGSSLGASILLKSESVRTDWPSQYLHEMRQFATSGALGHFFAELDALKLDKSEAANGAKAVFSALAMDD